MIDRDASEGANSMNFRSMSIDKLVKLKDQVERTLSSKVAETERMLASNLAKLNGFGAGSMRGRRSTAGGKVAPKYRNPENPSETWAGRGLKPRWLAAALKAGKKLQHFSIASTHKAAPKKTRKSETKAGRKVGTKRTRKPRAAARPRPAPTSSAGAEVQA